jgi:H+-translocating NAD(P) transhydrogenase subunit beta
MGNVVQISYFIAAALFILGLKRMSSPVTARGGILWAGGGMLLATVISFTLPDMHNIGLMLLAIAIGSAVAWVSGKRVAMTDMPQMIALYNGMGGGAAAAIAAVELVRVGADPSLASKMPDGAITLGVIGAMIGSIAFTGSLIAFAKLQGWMNKAIRFPKQQQINAIAFGATVVLGILAAITHSDILLALFFVAGLTFGILMTIPIGGADMPVVISLYNALTGLAVGFEGFVLGNAAMIIAGTVVGAAGTLLTQLMAKAMNRSISNILFSNFGTGSEGAAAEGSVTGTMKAVEADDAAVMLSYAQKVIIVPGYGLAVAQAQHKVWELTQLLRERGIEVKFAIHPVAGRMPGHMNVLLAEAGVPYDIIADMDEINAEFATTDVSLVIGANDVVNPVARTDASSPIYGMPILNVDQSKQALVVKRGRGAGFSGVENALFYHDNTRMLYGDAQAVMAKLIQAVKQY